MYFCRETFVCIVLNCVNNGFHFNLFLYIEIYNLTCAINKKFSLNIVLHYRCCVLCFLSAALVQYTHIIICIKIEDCCNDKSTHYEYSDSGSNSDILGTDTVENQGESVGNSVIEIIIRCPLCMY